MINLLLLVVLAWQFYIGYSRGILLQGFYLVASLISLVVASQNYQSLANRLSLWLPYANPTQDSQMLFFKEVNIFTLDTVFYKGAAFLAIYLMSYSIFRLLGVIVQGITINRLQQQIYQLIAGALSLITSLISLSLTLNLAATIPFALVQTKLATSLGLSLLIKLPILSQLITQLWVQ